MEKGMSMIARRSLGMIAAMVCALVFSATDGLSATLYVDAGNSTGSEDGSSARPFNTIQEAIDAAAEDDTISVAPGTYYGGISLNRGFKLLSQQGPQSTIIEGGLSGYYVDAYHNYYVNGFTLGGVSLIRTWEVVVENCIFNNNPNFYISLGAGFTARHCVISGAGWLAVHTMFNGGPRFENVTLDVAGIAFRAVYSTVRAVNVSISNVETAFYFNPGYWGSASGSNVNCWNCQQVTSDPALVNITNMSFSNPLYVAPPQDYRLQAGSPLIDAGIDIGLPYVGAAPDIGAYEFSELSLAEKIENLAMSFSGTPAEIFREPGEQRKVALYQKFEAILKLVYMPETGANNPGARLNVLNGCLAKLQNDILDKTDGDSGGNPNNDWLESGSEKMELYDQVLVVIGDVQAALAANQ